MRLLITGGPRTGKTTLANVLHERHGWPLMHTDDAIRLGWSESSAAIAHWFDVTGPWIIEGVTVPRALRKWLAAYPTGRPCDELLVRTETFETLTPGQARMLKGLHTVLEQVLPELKRRGVVLR